MFNKTYITFGRRSGKSILSEIIELLENNKIVEVKVNASIRK